MSTSDNTTIPPLKRCSKCGEEKPATPEYFALDNRAKDGMQSYCKQCKQKIYECNKEHILNQQREYNRQNRESRRAYLDKHHKQISEKHREWREKNRYAVLEYEKNYREQNRKKRAEYARKYNVANRQRINIRNRSNHQRSPFQVNASRQRRRARKHSLPNNWTSLHWARCLEYWHGCCAVCGGQLRDLFGQIQPHADHWIPLAYKGGDNPGTVPVNMICLCSSCNCSKYDNLPADWLIERFGKRKAAEILKRITAYFEWVEKQ